MATVLSTGLGSLEKPPSLPAAEDSAVARYLELYSGDDDLTECPTGEAEIQALLSEHNLKHGDVVNFGDYRDSDSHIVFRQKDGKLTLLANPDDRGAGYLTIPKVIGHHEKIIKPHERAVRDDYFDICFDRKCLLISRMEYDSIKTLFTVISQPSICTSHRKTRLWWNGSVKYPIAGRLMCGGTGDSWSLWMLNYQAEYGTALILTLSTAKL